jgi:hypothetical protein
MCSDFFPVRVHYGCTMKQFVSPDVSGSPPLWEAHIASYESRRHRSEIVSHVGHCVKRALGGTVSPATRRNFTKTTVWHNAPAVRSHGLIQLGAGLKGGSAGQLSLKPTHKERNGITAVTGNMMLVNSGFPKAKIFLWKLSDICARALTNVH